jgi:predicted HTH domain antitoxin
MQITIELPEIIGQQLQMEWGNLSQKALEALAIQAYRDGIMTSAEIQTLLNFCSRWETEEFLKRSQVYLDYTEEDLAEDVKNIEDLLSQ